MAVALVAAVVALHVSVLAAETQKDLDVEKQAWLDGHLAPLRSDDIEAFKKKCLEIAEHADRFNIFPGPSVWEERYPCLQLNEEITKILKEILEDPKQDPRFVEYALVAARSRQRDFVEHAIRYLESDSVDVQRAAARFLTRPFGGLGLSDERKEEVLRKLVPLLEGEEGGKVIGACARWSRLLPVWKGAFSRKFADEYAPRLQALGERYIKADRDESRSAAAALLGELDFEENQTRLLVAFEQETVPDVAAAMLRRAFEHRKKMEDVAQWQMTGVFHRCALQTLKNTRRWPRGRYGFLGEVVVEATYPRAREAELGLRVLAAAKERMQEDPAAPEKALRYVHKALGRGSEVRGAAIPEVLAKKGFTFTDEDKRFWLKHGLDKKLCEVLLEASKKAQKAAAEKDKE